MLRLGVPFVVLLSIVAAGVVFDRPLPRADFVFINRGDATTLDLQRMSWTQDFRLGHALYEGLVRKDVFTRDYAPRPGVAERWDVSPDRLRYTFHLRADARWSNGEPVTAGDFAYSWRRALLPDTASDYTGMMQCVAGAPEFFAWRERALTRFATRRAAPGALDGAREARALWAETERVFGEMVGVHAPDDRTFVVTLDQPVPFFLDLCAFPVFFPVYPPLVRQYETLDPRTGRLESAPGWTKPPRVVTNGPFMPVRWRFKRDMRLERNPHYWNRGAIAIETIDIPSVGDGNAAVLAFETGAADWVTDVSPSYRGDMWARKLRFYEEHAPLVASLRARGLDQFEIDRQLPDDPRKNIHVIPAFGTYFWNFNCQPRLGDGRPNPFADARVRRAFAMAVDKQAIVDTVRRCGEPVARTLTPPGSVPGYTPPGGLDCLSDFPDAEGRRAWGGRARALLAEAGWPDPAAFPVVELLFNKDLGHDLVAEILARDWERTLGVRTVLAQKEVKVFRSDLRAGNFMVSRAGWYGDYGDPLTFLDISRTGDGNNDRKYSSAAYDGLLDRAAVETDPGVRLRILAEAERLIVEQDVPLLPLHRYATVCLFDPDEFTGLSCGPRGDQLLDRIDVFGDGRGTDIPKAMPGASTR